MFEKSSKRLPRAIAQVREKLSSPTVVLLPTSRWSLLELHELWEYRDLLFFFVWRDIKVRYKQTFLGAAWAIMQPLFAMIVFTVFFGKLARMPSDGIPYPVFTYAALAPWMYFANALSQASNSLIEHERILTKVYFPRILLPMAAALSGLIDFVIAFTLLGILLLMYGIVPSLAIVTIPLLIIFATVTALSVGLWLSALNVQYRDVRYTVPFLVQFWLFATPVVYPSSLVPKAWRPLYGLNPMAGVIDGFRWALFGQAPETPLMILVSMLTVLLILTGGLFYFHRIEQTFADVV